MNRNSFSFEVYQESDLESRRDDSALGEGVRAGGLGVAAFRCAELRKICIMRFTGASIQFVKLGNCKRETHFLGESTIDSEIGLMGRRSMET